MRVANFDVIDGTPVIDIKPYEPGWDCIFSAKDHDRTEKQRRMLPADDQGGPSARSRQLPRRTLYWPGAGSADGHVRRTEAGCDLRLEDVCVLIGKNHCISDSLIGITGARLGNNRLYYNLNPKVTRYKDSYSIYNADKTIVFRLRRFMKDFDSILDCKINDLFDIEVL